MKTINRTWWISLTTACGLLLTSGALAQETGEADATATNTVSEAAPVVAANEPVATTPREPETRPMPMVLFGQNAELKPDDTAETVVVIGGSAEIHGHVERAVVAIGGNVDVDGTVGDAVVAVMGNVHLKPGAKIHRDAVAVLGTLDVATGVTIGGNAVSVGGELDVAPGAIVHGQKTSVGLPIPFVNTGWLGKWLRYCVFELRPLAPQVGFVWVIAAIYFLLYLFIAAVFPHPVQVCVDNLTRRPATTFLIGVLTKLLIPLVFLILAITGVGLLVVPFLLAALFLAAAVGKVAILEWIGLRVGKQFGRATFHQPVAAFLVGTLIITLLYLVPVLGLLVYTILAIWGLGCAVTAVFSSVRHEAPVAPITSPPIPGTALSAAAPSVAPAQPAPGPGATAVPPVWPTGASPMTPSPSAGQGTPAQSAPPVQPAAPALPIQPPTLPDRLSYPKAGFWERMGAALLDVIIVIILGVMAGRFVGRPPFILVVAVAYFAGFWAWKGTTPGGIILKLQVVRADGGPVTFAVALVRALAAALSIVVLFLGFLWIAWDKDKEGWHDKIAGTQVVRLPRALPLVCL